MEDFEDMIEEHRLRNERLQEAFMIMSCPDSFQTEEERNDLIEWAKNVIHNQGVYIPNKD